MTQGSRLVVVGGGARSGKSRFALGRAKEVLGRRVLLATAEALDDEMHARIARHKADRDPAIRTVEEPRKLVEALKDLDDADVVVIDCVTLWLSNLLCDAPEEPERITLEVERLLAAVRERPFTTIAVTNEVGMGLVPDSALGRTFRDVAGTSNQRLALAADELYLAAMGVVVRLRPQPLGVVG